jgi:two-component SAPR family response regulator
MRLFFIFFVLWLIIPRISLSQGLKFSGGHQPIEKRTSYEVFSHKKTEFTDNLNIDFDLSLFPPNPIGYILRIKSETSNRIFNLFYDEEQNYCVFRLNEEGKSNLITARIDRDQLTNLTWFKVSIKMNLLLNEIRLQVHNTELTVKDLDLPHTYHPRIVFGKSDYLIDLPNFAIKNLTIGNTTQQITIPLSENEGNNVHDIQGDIIGEVSNPEWLINDAYRWKFVTSSVSLTQAGSNYNDVKKEVYYFNRDSMLVYNVRSQNSKTIKYTSRCPIDLVVGTSFIDQTSNKLYVYEIHHVNPYDGPSVASLDLDTYTWKVESSDLLNKELHHHGYFYNPTDRKFTIFGGYGQMRYSDKFYSYDLNTAQWKMEGNFKGELIYPRYFLSIGYLKEHNTAYIFGGMGNESGEHIVGRKYFYDLHQVDLNTNRISKVWEIPWTLTNVVPARGIIIPDNSHFYTLCYPEHVSNSFFKLYKFSIKDGSYEILGDSVPIYSDKITTRAQLYYDVQLGSLYALVQESTDDISSSLKIYSLNFPPISASQLSKYPDTTSRKKIVVTVITLLLAAIMIAYFIYRTTRRKKSKTHNLLPHQWAETSTPIDRPNAIYLFGEFKVVDRANKDITHLFSTRLKQALCLILEYSFADGITSKHLSSILWPDKPEDKVKNSRGVTINHLRKALSELDGIELEFEKGKFKIVQTEALYCDYTRCIKIIAADVSAHSKELIQILNRGYLLQSSNDPLFDAFKANLERQLEPVLHTEIEKSIVAQMPYMTIALANAVFQVDPLNDYALLSKIKAYMALKLEPEARSTYQSFVIEYKKIMGENYPHSYQDLE